MRLDIFVGIFFAVVIGKLFSGLDIPYRIYFRPAFVYDGFAVRFA
ncbi:MAG: hypothetical protein UW95_C0023G0004 [Parcubacteria group bacterium GW2011_GWC1_45_14]|nr:MAG: hypothetical protein UW95_C0023G0004 [Parcubacteria group bacterium GW2011_GWC1_45_14]